MALEKKETNNNNSHFRWLLAFCILAITTTFSIALIGERSCIDARNIGDEVIQREANLDEQAEISKGIASILIKAREGRTAVARGEDPHTNDEQLNKHEVLLLRNEREKLTSLQAETTSPDPISCPLTGNGQ